MNLMKSLTRFVALLALSGLSLTPVFGQSKSPAPKDNLIVTQGFGLAASTSGSLDVRRQEAFLAAFCDALRKLANDLNKYELGDFRVDTNIMVEGGKVVRDEITVEYKNQRFIVNLSKLVSPAIEQVNFPKWNDPAIKISNIEILAKRDTVERSGLFEVEIGYPKPNGR